jgi:hypothetical protein
MSTPARRRIIGAAGRRVTRLDSAQLSAAEALLDEFIAAAARHGFTLDDLDLVADMPEACISLIALRRR